jgi:hypothetical protein
MSYARTVFGGGKADPEFSIELPPGLILADLADMDHRPPSFTFAFRFAAVIAVNGPASISFYAMPAPGAHSLARVLHRCAAERGSKNPSLYFENIGGESHRHPGLLAAIEKACELALFEDGGTVLIMEAAIDPAIWTDYEPFLQRAMLSVERLAPRGPTLPLSDNGPVPELEGGLPDPDTIAAAARETELERKARDAQGMIEDGRFDDAEKLMTLTESGPEVCAILGRLYEARLSASSEDSAGSREELYRRALDWRLRSYPEPHTEIEAEAYRSGMDEDRTRLIELLGYPLE